MHARLREKSTCGLTALRRCWEPPTSRIFCSVRPVMSTNQQHAHARTHVSSHAMRPSRLAAAKPTPSGSPNSTGVGPNMTTLKGSSHRSLVTFPSSYCRRGYGHVRKCKPDHRLSARASGGRKLEAERRGADRQIRACPASHIHACVPTPSAAQIGCNPKPEILNPTPHPLKTFLFVAYDAAAGRGGWEAAACPAQGDAATRHRAPR